MPGMGQLTITSALNRDLPMIQGLVLFSVVVVLVINLAVDIAYGWLSPRVRAR
jgi:peptide/nickel transport system permease protein